MDQLIKTIKADLLNSLKNRDSVRVDVLRLVISDLNSVRADSNDDLPVENAYKVIRSHINSMREATKQFSDLGKDDAAARELAQISILEQYVPATMSAEQVSVVVDQVISETKAKSMQDMGIVMPKVMAQLQGKVDGALVQQIVKEKLS